MRGVSDELTATTTGLKLLLILPGATALDEQGRLKGRLDVPLSNQGAEQVARTVDDLAGVDIKAIYSVPSASCEQTASALAVARRMKYRRIDGLHNRDYGLWHAKSIAEVRQNHPRVYRLWQEHPETACPPAGESIAVTRQRAQAALVKLLKKYKDGVIALVAPEPLASVCRSLVSDRQLGDLWKAECDCGRWEVIDVECAKLGL